MSSIAFDARPSDARDLRSWLSDCQRRLDTPPSVPRMPWVLEGEPIGSLHPDLVADSALFWPPPADATEALGRWADHLRSTGRCGAWRGERVAVKTIGGATLAAVERGVARMLGIRTEAVHLVGRTPGGLVWLQQRSLNKPDDPGLWDTLVGGLVAHGESLEDTLQRETWEEAGLLMNDLTAVEKGGAFDVCKPSADGGQRGHVFETLHWFASVVPEATMPINQDGEVERFETFAPDAVRELVLAGRCTDEAAWILGLALGWPMPPKPR